MKKIDFLNTLFVGIDVSSKTNTVCALDFSSNQLLNVTVSNNNPGAEKLASALVDVLQKHKIKNLIIALESTSFYSTHIATFLSSNIELMPFNTHVYCLNPKVIANYRKSFIGLSKTDPLDSFIIADFARCGRISSAPWRGSQYLALQRLTRHRLHIVECITREKTYMISNMFLKFSELSVSDDSPFCNNYGKTAESILTELLSLEEITNMSLESLVDFICDKGKNRFANPINTAELLKTAARNSYRLDACLYEPITISLACSFNCIKAFESELKTIDKAIIKAIRGFDENAYTSLMSIPGIGPVYASGILAEIGSIADFKNHDSLAKYAGLVWKENQSGNFTAQDTRMSKQGNRYLRYYLIEATNSVKNHVPTYNEFYYKKYDEVKTHQHKRALALTSRKFIRLIFSLLDNNQLFSDKVLN